MLEENQAELRTVLQDAFDDAILMGVGEAWMRRRLVELVEALPSPHRPASPA